MLCPAGRAAPQGGADACTVCNDGFFSSAIGATACSECDPGYFADDDGQKQTCEPCPSGVSFVALLSVSPRIT